MIDVLSEIDLFDGVDPDIVNGFLAKGQEMRLEVGDKLFKEGVRLGLDVAALAGEAQACRDLYRGNADAVRLMFGRGCSAARRGWPGSRWR